MRVNEGGTPQEEFAWAVDLSGDNAERGQPQFVSNAYFKRVQQRLQILSASCAARCSAMQFECCGDGIGILGLFYEGGGIWIIFEFVAMRQC